MRSLLSRLASRKFLAAVVVAVLEIVGLGLSPEVIALIGAWIIGEAAVDATASRSKFIG
jgi:hypothetical protein